MLLRVPCASRRRGDGSRLSVCGCITLVRVPDERFVLDLLDDEDPFEIDRQAKPPAHWLMVAEVSGQVLVVPLAPPDYDDVRTCRPIGCYEASQQLADQYRRDR